MCIQTPRGTSAATIAILAGDKDDPTMDRLFRYLSRHGLITIIALHPIYKLLRLMQDYASGARMQFDFRVIPYSIFAFWHIRLSLDGEFAELSFPLLFGKRIPVFKASISSLTKMRALGVMLFMFLGWWIFTAWLLVAASRLPWKLPMNIIRSWSPAFASAARSVPLLIAVFIILFTTGDAWRLYGTESGVRIELLIALIAALTLVALIISLARIKGGWRSIAIQEDTDHESEMQWIRGTPAQGLEHLGVAPLKLASHAYASRSLRINIYILFWVTLIAHLASVAVLVFFVFVFIGLIAVSPAATTDLLGKSVVPLFHAQLMGEQFVITRPLIALSALFGCIAALTFATVNLQDDQSLAKFLDFALVSYRRYFTALRYYLGGIADAQQKLPWKSIAADLRQNDRAAIIDLARSLVSRSDDKVIGRILELARKNNFSSWAAYQGLSILTLLSDDVLKLLPAEDVDFVLRAAETDPANAKVISDIKGKIRKDDSE